MTIFWIIVFVIALASVAFIGAPLALGAPAKGAAENDPPLPDDAIDRDLDYGLIDGEAAREARRDARAAAASAQLAPAPDRVAGVTRFIAYLSLGAAPLAAVILYLNLGSPQSLGATSRPEASAEPGVGGDIASLEARTLASPGDFDAWMALGDAYASSNRAEESARAFARAVSLQPNDAAAQASYGEALTMQAGGAVTGEAREAFEAAAKIAPNDPRANYYLAEGRYQVGAIEDAVRGWAALLENAPEGAPWFNAVAARMTEAAAQGSIALGSLGLSNATLQKIAEEQSPARAEAAPATDQAAAIAALPEDERRQMIE
ncbi:MAG: tetratricopeptide repeat protein, partial [Pseudomonadota bacterium]